MKIAGATLNQIPMDWAGNAHNVLQALHDADEMGVELLCFPELSICGYGCEDVFLSEWMWQKAFKTLTEKILPFAPKFAFTAGLPVKFEGKMYNCVAFCKNREIQYIIPKQNLANDGVHYEPRWFTAWEVGKKSEINIKGTNILIGDYVIDFEEYKIGFEICEDAWREDRPANRLCKRGVNLILNPSASHFAIDKSLSRQDLVVSSSQNYDCTYIYANLLGNEAGRMIYDGELIIAKNGELKFRNELLSFRNYQLGIWDTQKEHSKIAESFESKPNQEFRKAVSLALFDYLRKSYSNGFILSLSGGADSSTSAVLVAEMIRLGIEELGLEQFLKKINKADWFETLKTEQDCRKTIANRLLTTAYQSTENSGYSTFESAKKLANEIGAIFYHWNIDDEVKGYTQKVSENIGRKLNWDQDDIALQNIQARARSPIIWILANIKNALLLTTSNRSEGSVGYTTMDGDTSGSIAPIAAIDKPFIIQWLRWAENNLGYKSLSYVNSLQPTAELRPEDQAQSDETDLMPYPLLQKIEELAIRERFSPVEIYNELKTSWEENQNILKPSIHKFFKLWSRNQWKRERIAVSFHLDDYNVDPKTWCRFPILSSSFKEELEELEKTE
ncbi:NAD(+) synthase [Marivirga tractuosa]|uniref:Glutamine-dependent NAD(+) synthetase n=1 Tax=Marivirga tractuosa (strain ATCC 23168 / DSM 4126 / NBRC 15989 / NCIMB 1408 / VKM B-1430 / H-43) TaxID=643867 RepID=E4TVQ2_MARTH|nr:NAD(+) synthase [Marivirga tractuosa]ADR21165.1 NAD+ synthetase [Marivirga tractuosa DSM 4126]BDD14382.1 NAD(+) synthase [Marivirga tractuosa]